MEELNENDIRNLLVFLNRTQLNGSEVPTFVELYSKLKSALAAKEGKKSDNT